MTRILSILLLPVLVLALPLMFAAAWVHEAFADMAARGGPMV